MAWAKRVEADQKLMEALGTCGAGMRFSELIDDYMAQWTGKCKNQIIRGHYGSIQFGNYKLIDIGTDLMRQQLKDFELGKCKRGDGIGRTKLLNKTPSHATVNRYRSVLSAIFKYAIGEGYLTVNPVARVPCRNVNNQRTRYLNDNERKRLLAACKTAEWDKLHVLVLMVMTTGMRKAELVNLRWCDVDFDKGLAFWVTAKTASSGIAPIPGFELDDLKPFREVGNGFAVPIGNQAG